MPTLLKDIDKDILNHWYILALEREIPTKRPVARTLYDTPYVLFRNSQNQISVLVDKCIHRGAQLSLGVCEQGQLRCPYHGWKYDGAGQVCEIPSDGPDSGASTLKRGWRASAPPTQIKNGCVWIWPGDPKLASPNPEWEFPEFNQRSAAKYFMITDFENEVGPLVQNFMDVPHTVFVHSKWFRRRRFLKVPVLIKVNDGRVKVTYQQGQDSIGFMASILNPKKSPMQHTDEFIFPNITRVDYNFGKYFFIINSQCSPITRHETRVFTWICYNVGPITKMISPFIKFYTRRVIEQDVQIMKNHGQNLKKFGDADARSTAADELHLAIDRIRALGAEDRSKALSYNLERERDFWI